MNDNTYVYQDNTHVYQKIYCSNLRLSGWAMKSLPKPILINYSLGGGVPVLCHCIYNYCMTGVSVLYFFSILQVHNSYVSDDVLILLTVYEISPSKCHSRNNFSFLFPFFILYYSYRFLLHRQHVYIDMMYSQQTLNQN